jgi:hypothetical protein
MQCANASALAALDAPLPDAAELPGDDEPHAASPTPAAVTATAAVIDLNKRMAKVYETSGNKRGTSPVTAT